MPQVPVVEGPRTQRPALRGGELTTVAAPTAAGSTAIEFGKGLMNLGEAGARIQERRDLDEAFRVETTVLTDYNTFEQNLRKTRKGSAAKGVVDDVDKWWSEVGQKYGADVSPRVKELTNKSLARARLQALDSAGRWQAQEEERSLAESYSAVNITEINNAAKSQDPATLKVSKDKLAAAAAVYGRLRGWDEPTITAEQQKLASTLHIAAINMMRATDPQKAMAYFEANKMEIDVGHRPDIEAQLKARVADQVGGDAGREVFRKYTEGKGYNEAIPTDKIDDDLVKKLGNQPEALRAARQEMDRQVALRNKAQSEQSAGAINSVFKVLNNGGTLAQAKASPAWDLLTEEHKRQITNQINDRNHMLWARSIEDRHRLDIEQERKFAPYVLASSQPEVLSKMSKAEVINLAPTIGWANTEKLLRNWQAYQQDAAKLSDAKLDNDSFKSILAARGINPNPSHTDQDGAAIVLRARAAIETRVGEIQRSKNRELTRPEKDQIITEIVNQEVLRPRFFGYVQSPTSVLKMTPEELRNANVSWQVTDAKGEAKTVYFPLSNIPVNEYEGLVRAFTQLGLPTDPTTIAREWVSRRGGKVK